MPAPVPPPGRFLLFVFFPFLFRIFLFSIRFDSARVFGSREHEHEYERNMNMISEGMSFALVGF